MWRVSKSLFLLREVGLSYIISTQELAALEHGKLKTVWISDDTETLICGLEEVSAEDFTEATLLTQPFHWTQQLHTNKSSQSNWICSNTGGRGVCLLELVTHPWPWQIQLQSCASNSELASTTHQVWGFYINSILLKRIVNNQRAPNARRHKMLPGVQKPDRLFTRQIRA